MEGYIYLIKSTINEKYYLGSTDNPSRRILEHNNGRCESTKNFLPWKCLLIVNVGSLTKARKIEYYIKKTKRKTIS